jgi:Signal transduction histidine kinase
MLNITEIIPHIFFIFSGSTLINLALFFWHKNLDFSFVSTSVLVFVGCLSIAFYSGGITSPIIFILPSIIIAGYIMRRSYGRYVTITVAITLVIMYYLTNQPNIVQNFVPESAKSTFSLLSTIVILIMLGNVLGSFMSKNNYEIYQSTKQIEKQNKEKETLLKEIHHRVKNNLQIVMSLLKLQSFLIKDRKSLEIFEETRSRIYSMALTHEMLFKGEDLTNIGYDEYINNLITNLVYTYSIDISKVKTDIKIPAIKINLDTAIPLGLLINEIITNALKYGKKPDGTTNIYLSLETDKADSYILEVGDNGIGIDRDLSSENSESLGLQLIETLAEQLDGAVVRSSENGTSYKICFKGQ